MELKSRDIIFALVVLLLIIIIGYVFYSPSGSNYFPISGTNPNLNYNDYYKTLNPGWDKYCLNPKSESLVILMHITKKGDHFNISCEYGPMFNKVMSKEQILYINSNVTLQFADTFTGCNEDYARTLHNLIVKTSPLATSKFDAQPNNRILPLDNPISSPDSLSDYYAIIIACHQVVRPDYYISGTYLYDVEKNRFYV